MNILKDFINSILILTCSGICGYVMLYTIELLAYYVNIV